MKCDKCRWYAVTRILTKKEAEFFKMMRIVPNVRSCCLGGCDGSRFEDMYESYKGKEHGE